MEVSSHAADRIDLERAFGGVIRLYGHDGFARIRAAHGIIVGIGGVGSWAAEALARSGLGRITLIDMDVVAESNLNRQAHATLSTLGANKVDAMRARIQSFAPNVQVDVVDDFLTPDNVATLIPSDTTFVIDAADKMRAKVAMVLHCLSQKTPLITCGSAGGKSDASRLKVDDLTFTEQDALLAKLRVDLRQNHGFPRGKKKFHVAAVFSPEPPAEAPIGGGAGLACAGYGSAMHMTASMGMLAAGHALTLTASAHAEAVLGDSAA